MEPSAELTARAGRQSRPSASPPSDARSIDTMSDPRTDTTPTSDPAVPEALAGPEPEGGPVVDARVGQGGRHGAQDLRGDEFPRLRRGEILAAARDEDRHRHGGVEVRPGDVAEGVDHAHQRAGDGPSAVRGPPHDVEADGDDEHVGAQELAGQLRNQGLLAAELVRADQSKEGDRQYRADELPENEDEAPTKALRARRTRGLTQQFGQARARPQRKRSIQGEVVKGRGETTRSQALAKLRCE